MQLNYSYLKILKLKINSFFLVKLFCALLDICFFSPFLNVKSQVFAVGFVEKPPELTKDQKLPPFAE